MRAEFAPEQYQDDYREALMKIIEAKLERAEIVEVPAPAKGKVIDLMAALKASVEAAKGRKPVEVPKRVPTRRRRAAAG